MKRNLLIIIFCIISFVCINGHIVCFDTRFSINEFIQMSEVGNAKKQYELSLAYFNGEGVAQNVELAISWLKKSASSGYCQAESDLGFFYCYGLSIDGVEYIKQNSNQAEFWLTEAAVQGDVEAQAHLGALYINWDLKGIHKNVAKAAYWLLLSAKNGSEFGSGYSSLLYIFGWGVELDYLKAETYAMRGLGKSEGLAELSLGIIYSRGEKRDNSKAKCYLEEGGKQGNILSLFMLGDLCYNGDDMGNRDYEKAFDCFKSVAESTYIYPPAMRMLAICYRTGRGCRQDLVLAKKWIEKAIEYGDTDALMLSDQFE